MKLALNSFPLHRLAAILKYGGHLGFEGGFRTFLKLHTINIVCAKFGACITK